MANFITIPVGPIFQGGACRGIIHVIERGDTLYKLGQRYHVSVSELMYANPYVNVYNLQIGDELCIPVRLPQPRNTENAQTAAVRMPEGQMNQGMSMGMPEEQMQQDTPMGISEEQMRQEMPVGMPEEQMEGRMRWMPEEQMERTEPDRME